MKRSLWKFQIIIYFRRGAYHQNRGQKQNNRMLRNYTKLFSFINCNIKRTTSRESISNFESMIMNEQAPNQINSAPPLGERKLYKWQRSRAFSTETRGQGSRLYILNAFAFDERTHSMKQWSHEKKIWRIDWLLLRLLIHRRQSSYKKMPSIAI